MRVGLLSPYSYTYPGGVAFHVEALAAELREQGNEVRILCPYDPDDRHARIAHRGAAPKRRPVPDHLIPLGRTVALPANGSTSNLAWSPTAVARLGHELRAGAYDILHVHEPNAPLLSWCATELARMPVVGTFHTCSTGWFLNTLASRVIGARRLYRKLHVRIAVSAAARWTAERFYGGSYRVIPNGVDLRAADRAAAAVPHGGGQEVRILFVGRADERKGLPVLVRAFEALRAAGVPVRLAVAGAGAEDVAPVLIDGEGIDVLGPVSEEEKWRLLVEADIACAPSLGGESFGMVLTEALAARTAVVCSDIAGYRDVVRDGVDGLLVSPGQPAALAEALRALAEDRARRERMALAARERAAEFSWPSVADRVMEAYEDARAAPEPSGRLARAAARTGMLAAAPGTTGRARRIPPLEPRTPTSRRERLRGAGRRAGLATGAAACAGLALLALSRIGLDSIARAILAAAPVWVLAALALMSGAMLLRAEAWRAIIVAALPGLRVRRADTARATMIGVLMSATLPARLGEPSRALIMARRLGRVRERLPIVLGTLVSQTLLNILALVVLGAVVLASAGVFRGREEALLAATIAPLVLVTVVLLAPVLLRGGAGAGSRRLTQVLGAGRRAMVQVRQGLGVFRRPRLGASAAAAQLAAWALQWLACYVLLVALGLDERAGVGAAAAILFAVNVTAALPATPSNIGVFQAVCVAVLSAYGIGYANALAYGIVLQAVEIATSLALGMPALVREGMSWRDMRLRALHTAPVELRPPGATARAEA